MRPLTALKVRRIGNAVGIVIPVEILGLFHAQVGDTIHATPAAGSLRLTPYDPVFETQMAAMRTIMRKNRNALRALSR